jgi:phosphoglycerate dehydrogenase-like enzyme
VTGAAVTCALLDDYQSRAHEFADWDSLQGVTVTSFSDPLIGNDSLAERLEAFDVIVAMRERTRFDKELFARLPRLKLLVTTGMRNAAIDLDAANGSGVVVSGTSMLYPPAAELTWALLLALARQVPVEAANFRAGGPWQVSISSGVTGKTLGIIGLGRLGAQVARYAHAFDMPVLAWSPHLTVERCEALGVEQAPTLDHLLTRSDFVTVHVVLSDTTRNLLGARELSLLKPSALLVNTSRGPLINEEALVAALTNERIAGAALDVFDTEPLGSQHPLRRLPNVLATPHIGYVTAENYRVFYGEAVEDIAAWRGGSAIRVLNAAL